MFDALTRSTFSRGPYSERPADTPGWFDRAWSRFQLLLRGASASPRSLQRFVRRVDECGRALQPLGRAGFAAEAKRLRQPVAAATQQTELVARTFALTREAAGRVLGQRHYDEQIMGGWALLQGMACEMETGEGKTLTATLAAATAALSGVRVHVITANDYLAERDAGLMGPVYAALGLSTGLVKQGMEHAKRQREYARDITYTTSKEVAFDFLRDRITLGAKRSRLQLQLDRLGGGGRLSGQLLLRGLEYAIVDELDSVLVDEARTPLLISTQKNEANERRVYETACAVAQRLERGLHFKIDGGERAVRLTESGRRRLEELTLARTVEGPWRNCRERQELVVQALAATHFFIRDQHYIVRDGAVQIVDENTGRTLPDRAWEHGLHQAIETKEGCVVTGQRRPVARIIYQKFFRRYLHLAGMTGTAREVAGELADVYGLATFRLPTHRPSRRVEAPTRVYCTSAERWRWVVCRVRELHSLGRPVLVGTRSVEASEVFSRLLAAEGLPHRVLNARQDREEADVVRDAGKPGAITVATNMAGRGTDIRLDDRAAVLGGLHVIASELHESRRIDRQLFGRCARQGDPGSHEAVVSLEDELVETYAPGLRKKVAAKFHDAEGPLPSVIGERLFRHAQRVAEHRHRRARGRLLQLDDGFDMLLSFTGPLE